MAEQSLPPEYFGKINSRINDVVRDVYNGKKTSGFLAEIGEILTETTRENYSNIAVDYSTPDAEMLTRLTRDVWQFSAAKNYKQMRDITLALRDESGKLREYAEFKEQVNNISSKYNSAWLQSEYNLAIASSQNAARWVQFNNEAKDIPYLMYQTIGDSAVRESHAKLDGITRKIKDSFWSTHYPPNGYGCRCEVLQAPGADKDAKDIPTDVVIPELFRTNLANTGLIYPKGHPYYIGIPKAELRKAIAYLPPENTYITVEISKNAAIDIHPLHGDNELAKNIDACKALIVHNKKAKIKLLPVFEEKDKEAKAKYYTNKHLKKFPLKNADVLIDGIVAEIEISSGSRSSLCNCIRHGKKQSDFILLNVPDSIDFNNATNAVNGQLANYTNNINLTVSLFNSKHIKTFILKQKG